MKIIATITLTLLTSFLSVATWAADTGFSAGDTFEYYSIDGSILVSCDNLGIRENHSYRCYADRLDPAEGSYFVHTGGAKADEVTLTATHADGSAQKSTKKFDSAKGKSRQAFNLWIRTLFQKPLLDPGLNRIHYSMKDGKKAADSGDFEVNVNRGRDRSCDYRHYDMTGQGRCESADTLCPRYFAEQNDCR